jgi:hypothetical protein
VQRDCGNGDHERGHVDFYAAIDREEESLKQSDGCINVIGSIAIFGLVLAALLGCAASAPTEQSAKPTTRQQVAIAMFHERCKKAGEFVHRTVSGVEGVYLVKVRPKGVNYGDQYSLSDPYGEDLTGEGYIGSFVRGFYRHSSRGATAEELPQLLGYEYVEAEDPGSGVRFRYTGRIEEPWRTDKSYLEGYSRFVLNRAPAAGAPPRYAITYEDISTRDEREYWIAASSLKVIDLKTNEILAERVGYAVDVSQGSRVGNRSPWLWALDTACPPLVAAKANAGGPAFAAANYRAARFTEKVLRPATK